MRFFEAWTQLINPLHGQVDGKANNQVMTLSYPKDYKCTMSIAKFNKDYFETGIGFLYYCFIRAWPLSISSTPVNYDSGSILKLNVTFRYERYVMENVTKGMIRSGWKGYSDSFDPWMGRFNTFVKPSEKPNDVKKDKTVVNPTNTSTTITGINNKDFLSKQQKKNEERMKNIYKGDGTKPNIPNLPNLK